MQNLRFSSLKSFQETLSKIPLDQDENIYFFSRLDFWVILDQFLWKNILYRDFVDLMNMFESKDGILFEDELLKESTHILANIDIQWSDIFTVIRNIKFDIRNDKP
jgi:hypothetical protein